MTSVTDLFPRVIRRGHRRELLLLLVCAVCFLFGLVMVTSVSPSDARVGSRDTTGVRRPSPLRVSVQGGLYVFQIYDHFSCSGASLLLLSICQSVAIGWVYGTRAPSVREPIF